MNVDKKNTYRTLEQQIQQLWDSRGLKVHIIEFHAEKNMYIWTIKAKSKKEVKK